MSFVSLALAAQKAGDAAGAIRLLAAALAAIPSDRDALSLLIDLLLRRRDYALAILWLRRDLVLSDRPARTVQYLLFMLYHVGRIDEATVLLDRLPRMAQELPADDAGAEALKGIHRVVRRYLATAQKMTFAPGLRVFDEPEESREVRLWRKALTHYAEGGHKAALQCLAALSRPDAGPGFTEIARTDLDALKGRILSERGIQLPEPGPPADDRYLLIRSHSSGFCADVVHSACHLVTAEICRRTPVVFWGRESAYSASHADNLWDEFFELVGAISITDLQVRGGTCFPPPFTSANLRWSNNRPWFDNLKGASHLDVVSRAETIAVVEQNSSLAEILFLLPEAHPLRTQRPIDVFWSTMSRIRLRRTIRDDAKAWLDARRQGKPVIAVHVRLSSSDKVREALEQAHVDLDTTIARVETLVVAAPDARIFLMTDYQPYASIIEGRFGDRVFSHRTKRLETGTAAVQRQLGLNATEGNFALAAEVVRDIATGTQCDFFVGDGASNVSLVTAGLGRWSPDRLAWTRVPNVAGDWLAEQIEMASRIAHTGSKFIIY